MREKCIEITEVYITNHGSVFQCNKTNSYILEYAGKTASFKPTNFFDLFKRINLIDFEKMIMSNSSITDVEILMPPYCEHCYLLTITDLLNLKELLSGAKFSIHLNSVLSNYLQPSFSI